MESKRVQRSSLEKSLDTALASREKRWIRRRLPDPNTSSSNSPLIDFSSNDYLSLSNSSALRSLFLQRLSDAPDILGSGGSRLLVNGRAHAALEARLADFFKSETALLFNSGFDANVGFFSCVPQLGDVVVYDEYIHASVHDGIRASRARDAQFAFSHNSLSDLRRVLLRLKEERNGLATGENSVFLAVESLYSMDGTFAPLREIADMLDEVFPAKNGYLVVDEAHSTGIYGPQGRGRVAMLGLEDRVLARLHTFGKALAATGAVLLTNTLVRDYLLNYARSLIYTTSLSYANIIAGDCSFDMLANGTAQHLSKRLLDLSSYLSNTLRHLLQSRRIPPSLVALPSHLIQVSHQDPSPIIPIMTPHPRPLSAYLLALGMNARPITWPTVPKGKDRVRICLHAGNTKEDVDRLVEGILAWAEETLRESASDGKRLTVSVIVEILLEFFYRLVRHKPSQVMPAHRQGQPLWLCDPLPEAIKEKMKLQNKVATNLVKSLKDTQQQLEGSLNMETAKRTKLKKAMAVEWSEKEVDTEPEKMQLKLDRMESKLNTMELEEVKMQRQLDRMESRLNIREQEAVKMQRRLDHMESRLNTREKEAVKLQSMFNAEQDQRVDQVEGLMKRIEVLEGWAVSQDAKLLDHIWLRTLLDHAQAELARAAGLTSETDVLRPSAVWRDALSVTGALSTRQSDEERLKVGHDLLETLTSGEVSKLRGNVHAMHLLTRKSSNTGKQGNKVAHLVDYNILREVVDRGVQGDTKTGMVAILEFISHSSSR